MIRFSLKTPRIAAASLCLVLSAPTRTFAQGAATPQFQALENSASDAVSGVTRNPARSEAAPEAQLLNEDEIAELSQRNQNPGPEVRGGVLSNEHLTYIVIALAAIVLVLVLK
jgi:hypothetical protein